MLSPSIIVQNRYRIVRKLGEGGMGAINEAADPRVSCVVAAGRCQSGSIVSSCSYEM